MSSVHKQSHKLEKELIQINGLMEALQITLPDGNAHSCVANELEERLQHFQRYFYDF